MINAEKYFPAQLAELAEKPFLFTPPLIYKWRGGINRLGRIVFGIEGFTAMKTGNSIDHQQPTGRTAQACISATPKRRTRHRARQTPRTRLQADPPLKVLLAINSRKTNPSETRPKYLPRLNATTPKGSIEMNIELLTMIYGEISALYMLPLLRPHLTGWGGWTAAYRENGLPFADSRKTAEDLRKLVAAGLLTASGSTQGRGFKMTFQGALLGAAWSGIFIKDCQRAANDLKRAQAKTTDTLPATDWKIVMGFQVVPEAGEGWKNAYRDPQKYVVKMCGSISRLMPLLVCGFAELYPSYSGQAFALHLRDMPDPDQWQVDAAPTSDKQAGENWKTHCTGFDAGIVRFTRPPPAAFSGVIGAMIPASLHRN